jgi:pimeloyl-ACP methyl ester carboxylesterase
MQRDRASVIGEFINGPESFPDFDEILARTVKYNPTRTEASLRRGILHNAEQRDDGSWVWRHQRFRRQEPRTESGEMPALNFDDLWGDVERLAVPLLLCRGLREQSVLGDEDEAELRRRKPTATVEHFAEAGHSIQGDMPVELARAIESFVFA